jgi:hypothetical protein
MVENAQLRVTRSIADLDQDWAGAGTGPRILYGIVASLNQSQLARGDLRLGPASVSEKSMRGLSSIADATQVAWQR